MGLHRYNRALPPVYRNKLEGEALLLRRALLTLAKSEWNDDDGGEAGVHHESYELPSERALSALEKGVTRAQELKYELLSDDYPVIVGALLRGALTPSLDPGLRSKATRSCTRLLMKRDCHIPGGIQWRVIVDAILRYHVECIHGAPFWGRDIRDSHCRNLVHLLQQCPFYLPDGDDAKVIWNSFIDKIRLVNDDPDTAYLSFFLMSYLLPVRGEQWCGWIEEGIRLWRSVENCPLWDAQWVSLFAKIAKYQPAVVDWDDTVPMIFKHLALSLHLPLGAIAPHSPTKRAVPRHCYFLIHSDTISAVAVFAAYAMSPAKPCVRTYFERVIVLIENYWHPSNTGRWSSSISSFVSTFTNALCNRVLKERAATTAGIAGRVLSETDKAAVAPQEHRLDDAYVDGLVELLLPLLKLGINSKSGTMTRQACSAARDLSVICRHLVVPPMLEFAQQGLSYVQSAHRTSAALKLLASLSPTFLDVNLFPSGVQTLTHSLELILPGIDINDPSKTDGALRVLAAAAAQLKGLLDSDAVPGLLTFLEDYVPRLLDRIFSMFESLEAPPKKNRTGSFPNTAPQVSILVLTVAMDNLFAALPKSLTFQAAKRISRQISGSATMSAMKQYGILIRAVGFALAASSSDGMNPVAEIFLPSLLGQLLDESMGSGEDKVRIFTSLSKEELVWRIRMLAQTCRCVGSGVKDYLDRLTSVIHLSFDRDERPIYKAGGRLLRGILEGLTSIQISSESPLVESELNENGEFSHEVNWHIPSDEDWRIAFSLIDEFFGRAKRMAYGENQDSSSSIVMNREVLFRAIRLLHALQRGARWMLGGARSTSFDGLEKFEMPGEIEMTKAEALRAVRRPIVAGLCGEMNFASAKRVTELWGNIYGLIRKIVDSALTERPDDGILLYRCLEPIELANEPFKRAGSGKIHDSASQHYKNIYKSVLSLKRPHGSIGGSGRAMPHFIFRLRVAGMHDTRLAYAARPGSNNLELVKLITSSISEYTLNSFPRVRQEARGVYSRALRVTPSGVRRKAVQKFIDVLSESAAAASEAQNKQSSSTLSSSASVAGVPDSDAMTDNASIVSDGLNGSKPSLSEIHYDRMIGASHVLRSTVIAPLMMRSVVFYDKIIRAMVEALLVAERPDSAINTASLFFRLLQCARPLTLEPVRFVEADLVTVPDSLDQAGSCGSLWSQRRETLEGLNKHLLGLVQKSRINEKSAEDADVHWRLQSLVATLLYFNIREDDPPSFDIANFFCNGMISDVVSLRQICAKALVLILALHGTSSKNKLVPCSGLPSRPTSKGNGINDAFRAIDELIGRKDFVEKLIHTIALDHDNAEGGMGRQSRTPGGYQSILSLVSHSDGYSSWIIDGGDSWPKSMIGRSRDNIVLARVRLFENLLQNFGSKAFDSFVDSIQLIVEKVANEEKGIIAGVKDEDVRVIVGEVVVGVCRGMSLKSLVNGENSVKQATEWMVKILESLTGPQGVVTGGTLIRLVNTSEEETLGSAVAENLFDWLFSKKPIIAPAESGAVARTQARLLRYIYSIFSDIPKSDSASIRRILEETTAELMDSAGFAHELKAVRDEVARLLSLSVFYSDLLESFPLCVEKLVKLMETSREESGIMNISDNMDRIVITEDEEDSKETVAKKLRSRLGETLSRLVQIVCWSSRSMQFQKHFVELLPSLFDSLDDQDKARLSHARLGLSLGAQGCLDNEHLEKAVSITEKAVKSTSWKIRGGALPFVQVLLFMSQFTAPDDLVKRMRTVIVSLISDAQIEVRAAAADAFVPVIRDAPSKDIASTREMFLHVIKETQPPRRRVGVRRQPMVSDVIRKRHGAALGLSALVRSNPYSVPSWMPAILVALSNCVNDPPPISTTVKSLFADFMRTHRDEWQDHKQAFTDHELEIVLDLLVSPSYYA